MLRGEQVSIPFLFPKLLVPSRWHPGCGSQTAVGPPMLPVILSFEIQWTAYDSTRPDTTPRRLSAPRSDCICSSSTTTEPPEFAKLCQRALASR